MTAKVRDKSKTRNATMCDCDLAAAVGLLMGFLAGLVVYFTALQLAYRAGIVEYVGIPRWRSPREEQ